MKRYKTLLFDVDDTLLDFHAAQDQALDQLFTSVWAPNVSEIKICLKYCSNLDSLSRFSWMNLTPLVTIYSS